MHRRFALIFAWMCCLSAHSVVFAQDAAGTPIVLSGGQAVLYGTEKLTITAQATMTPNINAWTATRGTSSIDEPSLLDMLGLPEQAKRSRQNLQLKGGLYWGGLLTTVGGSLLMLIPLLDTGVALTESPWFWGGFGVSMAGVITVAVSVGLPSVVTPLSEITGLTDRYNRELAARIAALPPGETAGLELSGGIHQAVMATARASKAEEAFLLGWAISSTGDGATVAVSDPFFGSPDAGILNSGRVRLYSDPEGWKQTAVFAEFQSEEFYGADVAISPDGEVVVVGAPGTAPEAAGAVYVYARPAGGWVADEISAQLARVPGEPGSAFGSAVAISGDGVTVAVGAPLEGGSGKVRYFLAPQGWANVAAGTQIGSGFLGVGSPAPGDQFGASVAISRDDRTIVVGAPGRYGARGAVYIFRKPAAGWMATTELVEIKIDSGEPGDRFGHSVAVSADGSNIAVGAPGMTGGVGGIFVVTQDPASGSRQIVPLPRDTAHTKLGMAVAIRDDGKGLMAGSMGTGHGAVVEFVTRDGSWSDAEVARATAAPEDLAGSALGFSVDMSGDGSRTFVGAPAAFDGQGFWTDL